MEIVLTYAKYFIEHLKELLLDHYNPLNKAAYFGVLFDTPPSYDELVGGTHDINKLTGINELFKLGFSQNGTLVSPHIFEWNTLREDMTSLYYKLVELGMKYWDRKVYLADLEDEDV